MIEFVLIFLLLIMDNPIAEARNNHYARQVVELSGREKNAA